jgi:D-alanine-D-alanine ligase
MSATRLAEISAAPRATQCLDITVLCGGTSREREVSLASGKAVSEALQRRRHRVRVADISPHDLSALDEPADLIFIALHGTFGEDGQLQAILERRGLAFVGSDARSSALAMDKIEAKRLFQEGGIPTPDFVEVTAANLAHVAGSWLAPSVAKPANQGSSVDTYVVRRPQELAAVLDTIVNLHGRCLLERYIAGPELTVGILGEQPLPVCEIRTSREFYDYQAKYHDDSTEYVFETGLPAELLREVQTLSLRAHKALGCRDFSRVDFMIEAATLRPFILEVNTIPGFTDHSLLPKSARRVDIDFDGLCQRIVDLAMRRARG